MTVVVADTSPLLLIGQIEVLRSLYGQVVIPPEVLVELTDCDTPPEVLGWIHSRPEWLHIRPARMMQHDPELFKIDPGESAAILLALEEPECYC
jgi:predicted nucleic acid-binding protein